MKKYITFYFESKWYLLNIEDYSDFRENISHTIWDTLVTFQPSDLIRELNNYYPRRKTLPIIVDLESFDKQMSQRGKDIPNEEKKKWKVLSRLHELNFIDSNFSLNRSSIKTFLEKVADWYKMLYATKEEVNRFESIEIEINKIIFKRQKIGVNINIALAKQKCIDIEKKIYSIKNELQLFYKIFTPDEIATQKKYLEQNNYNVIKSYLYSFKLRRKDDSVCNLFYELLRTKQDLNDVLYILAHWGGNKKCYPRYIGFGSITSRIILKQPSLQNLRKQNRDIITVDDGKKLLYIDYAQFEAGILASLSGDKSLIKLYDSDIYLDFAKTVLKNEDRQAAKIYFYRYMYGDKTLNFSVMKYFKQYTKLNEFRKSIESEIKEKKKVGTAYGNFRLVIDEDKSHWALSHKIQATASLIFKQALIKVEKDVPEADFLIPMHDGAVYQIDQFNYNHSKDKIEKIYIDSFRKVCPNISPRVHSQDTF